MAWQRLTRWAEAYPLKKYANTNAGNGTAAASRLFANIIQTQATTMTCGSVVP